MRPRRARRRLSMTSLIDVIFLLLLFFMLTSTFSRFAEVPLPLGGAGAVTASTPPLFLRVDAATISLNGQDLTLGALADAINADGDTPQPIIVSVTAEATAQRLTDVLMALREVPNIGLNVLVPV